MNYNRQYTNTIAYPTIILTVVALGIYVVASFAAVNGLIAVGWVVLVNALMGYFLFTSMHEAGHKNIAGNKQELKWLNETIGWLSGIPLLAPFYLFKIIHDRHHAHTNDPEEDPDHWLASKNLLSLLFHSTTIFPVYIIQGVQLLFFKPKVMAKVKRELKISFVVLFLMIAVATLIGSLIGAKWILLLWVLPAVIAQVLLAIVFDWLPHHPHEHQARFLNTRIFDIKGLSFLLLGQNYHLIHHLYPRIPFYEYSKIYTELEDKIEEEGTEVVKW